MSGGAGTRALGCKSPTEIFSRGPEEHHAEQGIDVNSTLDRVHVRVLQRRMQINKRGVMEVVPMSISTGAEFASSRIRGHSRGKAKTGAWAKSNWTGLSAEITSGPVRYPPTIPTPGRIAGQGQGEVEHRQNPFRSDTSK
jgi:hypothetical protein